MGSASGAVVLFSAAKAMESLDLVRLWVLQGLLKGHVTYTVTRALHFEGPHPWLMLCWCYPKMLNNFEQGTHRLCKWSWSIDLIVAWTGFWFFLLYYSLGYVRS